MRNVRPGGQSAHTEVLQHFDHVGPQNITCTGCTKKMTPEGRPVQSLTASASVPWHARLPGPGSKSLPKHRSNSSSISKPSCHASKACHFCQTRPGGLLLVHRECHFQRSLGPHGQLPVRLFQCRQPGRPVQRDHEQVRAKTKKSKAQDAKRWVFMPASCPGGSHRKGLSKKQITHSTLLTSAVPANPLVERRTSKQRGQQHAHLICLSIQKPLLPEHYDIQALWLVSMTFSLNM